MDANFNLKLADFGFCTDKTVCTTKKGTAGYMAPEIMKQNDYSGQCGDIFALGAILFIMYSGHPPFSSPDPSDPFFSTFLKNRLDVFWKQHGKSKEEGLSFYSNDFMSLISMMLQPEPSLRPSITEIKNHKWFNQEVATADEVKEDLFRRRSVIEEVSNSEVRVADPDIYRNPMLDVNRGIDDPELPVLQVKKYQPGLNRTNRFFSTSPLNDLFSNLVEYAVKKEGENKFSKKTYKVTISEAKKTKDEECVKLTAEIFEVEEGKYCVTFTKKEGDYFDFINLVQEIKKYFGGHVNA
jgi:5'-AMP-activated protein kinase catalytic alpha subunit